MDDKHLLFELVLLVILVVGIDDLAENRTIDLDQILNALRSKALPEESTRDSKLMKLYRRVINGLQIKINTNSNNFYKGFETYILCISNKELEIKFDNDSVYENQFSLDEFWEIRHKDFAMDLFIWLLEISTDFDMEIIRQDKHLPKIYGSLKASLSHYFILVNELFSFRKEVIQNTYRRNYLFLKSIREQKGIQQIADEVVQEIKVDRKNITYYGNELIKNNPLVGQFINKMFDFCDGYLYHHSITKRYNFKDIPVSFVKDETTFQY